MTITAFRITKKRYLDSAFDGQGAKDYGGRWNSIGTPMVYASSTLSLATLELLVHIEDLSTLQTQFSAISITFDETIVEALPESALPANWASPQIVVATQILGDNWVNRATSAVLQVPSAITVGEKNYLINPAHPHAKQIAIGKAVDFEPDPRLTR